MGRRHRWIVAVLAGVANPASAVELADGLYGCTLSTFYLGDILIEDGTFRGPAFDGNFGDAYPVEVTEGGTINWGGPLGGISSDGNTVVSTVLKNALDSRIGFDIMIRNARGNFQTISCGPR